MPYKYINKNLIIKCRIEAVFIHAELTALLDAVAAPEESGKSVLSLYKTKKLYVSGTI